MLMLALYSNPGDRPRTCYAASACRNDAAPQNDSI
jgi:hypothetical protein